MLLLDSADHCGFTLINPMALPPEQVPVDSALWRSVFPPQLPNAIAKGGRWLFRGKPPDEAFRRGADEVAQLAATECGPEEEIRSAFRSVWNDAPDEDIAYCAEQVRVTVAYFVDDLRPMLVGISDPPSDADVERIGTAALDLYPQLREWMQPHVVPAWNKSVVAALLAEDMTILALDADLNGCLLAAAAEWKSFPGRYRAEDETPTEGENTYILTNEKMRVVRELTSVWPADALWPATTWTTEGRAAVEEARRCGSGAETEAMRQATVHAAADRILTLNDDMQDYREPEAGEAQRTPSRRMRVLLGTLDEISLASPENVPTQARDVFRAATRRHCARLWDEYRQANAFRQRAALVEAEASAARIADHDAADRAAGTIHAAGHHPSSRRMK